MGLSINHCTFVFFENQVWVWGIEFLYYNQSGTSEKKAWVSRAFTHVSRDEKKCKSAQIVLNKGSQKRILLIKEI